MHGKVRETSRLAAEHMALIESIGDERRVRWPDPLNRRARLATLEPRSGQIRGDFDVWSVRGLTDALSSPEGALIVWAWRPTGVRSN